MIQDVRELARDMREYIESHGWIQGRLRNAETGAVCLMGAFGSVTGWDNHQVFFAAFHRFTGASYVPWWNDAPERTYEDVILLLKRIEDGTDVGDS